MTEIVEPETRQACFVRQCSPGGTPAVQVPHRIEGRHVVVNHSLAAKFELRNEGSTIACEYVGSHVESEAAVQSRSQ